MILFNPVLSFILVLQLTGARRRALVLDLKPASRGWWLLCRREWRSEKLHSLNPDRGCDELLSLFWACEVRDPCQVLHSVSYLCLCCLLPSHRKFMRLHTFSLSFDYIMKNAITSEAVEGPAYRNEVILTSLRRLCKLWPFCSESKFNNGKGSCDSWQNNFIHLLRNAARFFYCRNWLFSFENSLPK